MSAVVENLVEGDVAFMVMLFFGLQNEVYLYLDFSANTAHGMAFFSHPPKKTGHPEPGESIDVLHKSAIVILWEFGHGPLLIGNP